MAETTDPAGVTADRIPSGIAGLDATLHGGFIHGDGSGRWLVYRIVALVGGDMLVAGDADGGTTATLSLPVPAGDNP